MRVEKIGNATLYLADCMDIMRDMPDKAFDLAIVDPPYGDGGSGQWQDRKRFDRHTEGGCPSDIRHWDFAPPPEYFEELFRVSRNQIIWGGNYFDLPPSRNFIIWRKLTISENFSMAMAEYAWTNIPGNAKVFECAPQDSNRFHPTQKPIALYKWLLSRYAELGYKILDTHGGSGSSVIACYDMGYPITWIEKDEDYFNQAYKRIEAAYQQPRLFDEFKLPCRQAVLL